MENNNFDNLKNATGGSEKNALNNKIKGDELTPAQKARVESVDNIINDHLTESDFSGTLRDLQGNPVPNGKGGYYNHMGEMKDSYNGLKKAKKALEDSLRNPNLSAQNKNILTESLNKANEYMGKIEKLWKPYGGIK